MWGHGFTKQERLGKAIAQVCGRPEARGVQQAPRVQGGAPLLARLRRAVRHHRRPAMEAEQVLGQLHDVGLQASAHVEGAVQPALHTGTACPG